MPTQPSLEQIVQESTPAGASQPAQPEGLCETVKEYVGRMWERSKKYRVDVTAAWTFYTPPLLLTEIISGMTAEEITKSRAMSFMLHTFIGRPYGMFRQWGADLCHVGPESQKWQKIAVDTAVQLTSQLATYPLMLYIANVPPEERKHALITGLIVGTVGGRFYGLYQDWWRKQWGGAKPTLSR